MLNVSDIELDLENGDIKALEHAFGALVDGQQEEEFEGVDDTRVLSDLLFKVAEALLTDQNLVPMRTKHALQDRHETKATVSVSTYDMAARFVLANRERFEALLDEVDLTYGRERSRPSGREG